jgi:argininosuccinate synthase
MTNTTPGDSPILLAFSGGLDTSFCVPWLAETYGRPVVTLTVDTGGRWSSARRRSVPWRTTWSTRARPISSRC